jgi:hypothetical protein
MVRRHLHRDGGPLFNYQTKIIMNRLLEEQPLVPALAVVRHPHNIYEGSEFLDDAIRTIEQPLMYMHTEEAIAVGSPDDLL